VSPRNAIAFFVSTNMFRQRTSTLTATSSRSGGVERAKVSEMSDANEPRGARKRSSTLL
jgi:hypothetical protein